MNHKEANKKSVIYILLIDLFYLLSHMPFSLNICLDMYPFLLNFYNVSACKHISMHVHAASRS